MSSLLLVVDAQMGFLNKFPNDVGVDYVNYLVNYIDSSAYDNVWATTFINTKNSKFVESLGYSDCMSASKDIALPKSLSARCTAVFKKKTYCNADKLYSSLVNLGIDSIDICGMDTESCVYATAMWLFNQKNFKVRVLSDLCMSTGGLKAHTAALQFLKANLGDDNVKRVLSTKPLMGEETPRSGILSEAESLVDGDRQDRYGTPKENFARISKLWSAYLGVEISPVQVANCMSLLKISRAVHSNKRDTYVDLAGYAALAGELAEND